MTLPALSSLVNAVANAKSVPTMARSIRHQANLGRRGGTAASHGGGWEGRSTRTTPTRRKDRLVQAQGPIARL
jgi:hypothetical protein